MAGKPPKQNLSNTSLGASIFDTTFDEGSTHGSKTAPPEMIEPDDAMPSPASVRVPRKGVRILAAVSIPVFAAVLVFALWQIFSIQFAYSEAAGEYEDLRKQVFAAPPTQSAAASATAGDAPKEAPVAITLGSVIALNPECTGWIDIPNSSLSYPFVRAADNDKYLNRTFLGKQNSAGAIFMDYRNPADLTAPHLILYGHNMKNGSMFGLLPSYLDAAYLQAHPTLVLYNQSKVYTYKIFSARVSDAYDASYRVDFSGAEDFSAFAATYGAPTGTSQMLTLSTCTNVQDEERILVHAALVSEMDL